MSATTQRVVAPADGRLPPLLTGRIPLEDAARAQRLPGEGRSTGKLVLT